MAGPAPKVVEQLLDDYATYDEHVDVVSAFEWLFTDPRVKELPATVAHFERFPRIPCEGNKDPFTPDFTVLFTDGTAIIAEIAKIALHDKSVDKLCRQIGNYASITEVPDGRGGLATVEHLDVMLLVNSQVGLSSVRRVIKERLEDPAHDYKPPDRPCIVQFSRSDTLYSFQRLPDPVNGTLYRGSREPNVGKYLDEDLLIRASRFAGVKAARAFINDPITPLYLATHLWTRTWPTQHGRGQEDITVDVTATANLLQRQYGAGRVSDVRRALELLQSAGLAVLQADGTWTVSRRLLGRAGDRDVHKIIARRISTGGKRLVTRRPAPQPTLPDIDRLF